jgi:hypothetical protein
MLKIFYQTLIFDHSMIKMKQRYIIFYFVSFSVIKIKSSAFYKLTEMKILPNFFKKLKIDKKKITLFSQMLLVRS